MPFSSSRSSCQRLDSSSLADGYGILLPLNGYCANHPDPKATTTRYLLTEKRRPSKTRRWLAPMVSLWLTFLRKKLFDLEKYVTKKSKFNSLFVKNECLAENGGSISYVPLIAPSTSRARIKFLATIADTFIYIVSKVSLQFASSALYFIDTAFM
jgi:hypothetical protein